MYRSSMLGYGGTNEVQYLIWTCPLQSIWKSALASQDTVKVFLQILGWSLHWLYLGRWPTHNWNGEEFAENSPYPEIYTLWTPGTSDSTRSCSDQAQLHKVCLTLNPNPTLRSQLSVFKSWRTQFLKFVFLKGGPHWRLATMWRTDRRNQES